MRRLSQAQLWQSAKPVRRRSVIQKEQLKSWFDAVTSLENKHLEDQTMSDHLLMCLFTGLRRNEAATLTWHSVDLDSGILTVKGDATKNHDDHLLPLSDFLWDVLKRRKESTKGSYVFPGLKPDSHLVESKFSVAKVTRLSGVKFMVHDLRRTFLTIAEGLDLPHYVLKRLANHRSADVTDGYIVPGIERLREPMQMIADYILEQTGRRKPETVRKEKPAKPTSGYARLSVAN